MLLHFRQQGYQILVGTCPRRVLVISHHDQSPPIPDDHHLLSGASMATIREARRPRRLPIRPAPSAPPENRKSRFPRWQGPGTLAGLNDVCRSSSYPSRYEYAHQRVRSRPSLRRIPAPWSSGGHRSYSLAHCFCWYRQDSDVYGEWSSLPEHDPSRGSVQKR